MGITKELSVSNLVTAVINKINSLITNHNEDQNAHSTKGQISYGQVDSTSTSTVFTATVNGITALTDGTTVMLRNGIVTSAAGFTLNVNGLGAKPVYSSMGDATAESTIFNINYTMMFVYDSTRINNGCWICYRGYNSDTNTIGYQIRTNSRKIYATDKTYRYRILVEVDDTHYMPVNTSTSTAADTSKTSTMNTREFKLGGHILYYGYTSAINANAQFGNTYCWQQYTLALGDSFNNANAALTLTSWGPVYMVAQKSTTNEGMAKLVSPYYTQSLPNTEDGKLYIFLGEAYSATNIEMTIDHPIYEYKNGKIRLYRDYYTSTETDTLLNGKANSSHTHTKSQITDFPTIPSKTSDLTNDSGFLTSHQSLTNYVQKSNTAGLLKNDGTVDTTTYSTFNGNYNNLSNKPTIPSASSTTPSADTNNGSYGSGTDYARANHTHPKSSLYAESTHTHNQYLTSHQDISGKEDTSNKVTSLSASSTDTEYPSAKAVYNTITNSGGYVEDCYFDTTTKEIVIELK